MGPLRPLSAALVLAANLLACDGGNPPGRDGTAVAATGPAAGAGSSDPTAEAELQVVPARSGQGSRPAGDPALADDLATLAAAVKLVSQEYALAVDDAGRVKDEVEIGEAELFCDQAKLRLDKLAPRLAADASAIAGGRQAIDALVAAVAARKPPAEVASLSRAATQQLLALGPSDSGATAGLRAATAEADRAIEAEQVASDYRIGVLVEPVQAIWRTTTSGSPERVASPDGAKAYLGVVLRERRSKRFLPGSVVTAEFLGEGDRVIAKADLEPLWGDFPQYGANLPPLADAKGRLRVRVEPPHHARHGDMLGVVAKPAEAVFDVAVASGRPVVPPAPPSPVDPDYSVGDDILEGFAAARSEAQVDGYRIGFITEPPEPFWEWKDGPTLKAVRPEDTHHLEIVLQDRGTGLLVPQADVALRLVPTSGGKPVEVPLHGLLSAFQHYGETLRVPPGDYRVEVDVKPPATAVLGEPRFLGRASTKFDWRVDAPTQDTQEKQG